MKPEKNSKKSPNKNSSKSSNKSSKNIVETNNFLSKVNLETKIIGLVVFDLFLAYTFYLSGKIGVLSLIKGTLLGVFGFGIFFIPILLGYYIYRVYKTREFKVNPLSVAFFTGAYFVLMMFLSSIINNGQNTAFEVFSKGYETNYVFCIGWISTGISNFVCKKIGQGLGIILFLVVTVVLCFLGLDRDIQDIWDMVKNWFNKMLRVDEDEHYKDFYNTKKIKNEEIQKRYKEQQEKEAEVLRSQEEKRAEEQKRTLEENKKSRAKKEVEEEVVEVSFDELEENQEDIEESETMNEEYIKYMREKNAKKRQAVSNALEGKFTTGDTKRKYVQKNQKLRARELKPARPAKFFTIEPKEQSEPVSENNANKIVFNHEIFEVRKEGAKLYEFVEEERRREKESDDLVYEETRRINEKLFNDSLSEDSSGSGSFLNDYINAESAIQWIKGENPIETSNINQQQSQFVNQQPTNINVNINVSSDPSASLDEEAIRREKYLAKVAILDEVYNKVKHEIIDYYNDNTKDNFDFTRKPRVNSNEAKVEEPVVNEPQTQVQPQTQTQVQAQVTQTQEPNFVLQPSEESQRVSSPVAPNINATVSVQGSGLTLASSESILGVVNNESKTLDLAKFREQREQSNYEDISQEITDELKEEIKGEVKEKILQEFVGRIVGNMSQEEKEEFLINMSKGSTSKNSTDSNNSDTNVNSGTNTTNPSATVSENPVVAGANPSAIGTKVNNGNVVQSQKQPLVQSTGFSQNNSGFTPNVNTARPLESQRAEVNKPSDREVYDDLRLEVNNITSPVNQFKENTQKVVDDLDDLHYNEYMVVENDNNNTTKNAQNFNKSDYETDFVDEYEQFEIEDIYNDDDFDLDEIESEYMELSQPKPKPKLTHIDTVASRNKPYVYPSIDILAKNTNPSKKMSESEVRENCELLEQTLGSFGVKATVMNVTQGPTVTRYEIQPGVGVKVSKIVGLTDDLALNLAAQGIRIEAPIPGKSAVGIEVPNLERESIFFRDILENPEFLEHESKIAVTLGKDISGKPIVTDIAKMPHVLVAGATGSGKSVCVNTIITSILYRAKPEECKLLMIDPKVVELSIYNGIPHLMIPVVTDPKKASAALQWAVSEMEQRYEFFAESSVRDLKGYNKHVVENNLGEKLPEVVIIVDELADLMMTAGKEVEESICRLAQKARAAGIYLIIATQRPSVDVITGLIKANIPSRIAFSVTSSIDSRTILDSVGAEKLLGRGDMLFKPYGSNESIRVQGAFISDKEVENIVKHLKENSVVTYDESIIEAITSGGGAKGGISEDDNDDLLGEALQFFIERDKASVSMLQTRFKVGYNRAARIVDTLESAGYIGESDGAKGRKILITQSEFEELGL